MKELIQIPLVHVPFGVWEPERLEWRFGKNPDSATVKQIVKGNKQYWDVVGVAKS